MVVQKAFAFGHSPEDRNNTPSSGDGAECESAFDPNTGQRIPGYTAPQDPGRQTPACPVRQVNSHSHNCTERVLKMPYLNDEWSAGYRPVRNNQPPQQDTGPVMTINKRGPGVAPPAMPNKETTVGSAFAALQAVVEAQRQHNAEVRAVAQHYTTDGLKARLREFGGTETARMVDQAEHVVAVRGQMSRDRYREMIGGQVDTSADAAQEQRNSRYLDQARRRIEAGSEPGQQIAAARAELARAADRNQRGLLAEELSTLFPEDNGWIQSELTSLDPELGSAAAELHKAELAHQTITHAAIGVRNGIRDGQPVSEQYLRTLAPAVARFDPDVPA